MSPEERAVGGFIDRAQVRARRLALAGRAAWSVLAAALAAEAALLASLPPVWVGVVWALAAAVAAVRRSSWNRAAVLARVERFDRRFRNLLVTADELRARPAAATPLRERIFADAAAVSAGVDLDLAFPSMPAIRVGLVATAAVAVLGATAVSPRRFVRDAATPARRSAASTPSSSAGVHVAAAIEPPAYTHETRRTEDDPVEIRAIEGSRLVLTVKTTVPVAVTHDGRVIGARGKTITDTLDRTGFLVIDGGPAGRRTIPIVVTPDALPEVRLTAPGRDLVFAGGNPRVTFEARATDDFGVSSLALRYTRVSGSGERFEFTDGEIPLVVDRTRARDWRATATRAIADLGLHEGDTLVYRAVASDARAGNGSATSDAFFIELSSLGVAAGDAFTLPEQETRYALSEQMLIVKTGRLEQARRTMTSAAFSEASTNLGVEQRMIRAEFVFMLGGEVEDEDVEAEQSTELQEGRLQNHGQRDLRNATVAMSRAEQFLTAGNPGAALAAEHAAVDALQRAFAKDRYILRALAARTELDLSRRLTGDLARASSWRRRLPDTVENRRAAQLQDLLRGIGALIGDARAGHRPPPARLQALAEQALRADPSSDVLRGAAVSLQRTADQVQGSESATSSALTAISAQIADEARRALAGATMAAPAAPSLRGAFADALASARSR